MAIALDAHTAAGITATGNPISSPQTFSHTVGNGANRLLIVTTQVRGGGIGKVVTGVTYNGIAMTEVDTPALFGSAHANIFYLINPPSGTHTVSVANNFTASGHLIASATSLTGVDQATALDAFNKAATSSAGPMSTAVTTTEDDCWLIDSCSMRVQAAGDTATMTAVSNRTLRTDTTTTAGAGLRGLVSTLGPAGSAGSKTMEWTKALDHDWAIMAAAFAPAATAHSLTISDFATASPAIDAVTLGQKHALSISNFATASPALGPPSFAQKHALTISNYGPAALDIATTSFNQKAVLSIANFSVGSPDIGDIGFATDGNTAFTISSFSVGSPSIAAGGIGFAQKHNLSIAAFATSPPVLGPPALIQRHALSISNFSTAALDIGTPALNSNPAIKNFTITDVEISSPSIGAVSLQQKHTFNISNFDVSALNISGLLLVQKHALAIANFAVAALDIGAPAFADIPPIIALLRANVLAADNEDRSHDAKLELRYESSDVEMRVLS